MARRHAKDTAARRTVHVGFYVTPDEREELDARAAATGLTLSEFARAVLLSDAKKPAPPIADPVAIRSLAFEITRVGTNLNQLARVANESRAMPEAKMIEEVTAKIIDALERVIKL